MSAFSKLYLFAYNSLQAIGWTTAFLRVLSNFISTKSLSGAYASAGELICLLQVIEFLEVIHGALGIVPTGVLLPFLQWGGRTQFVLLLVRKIIEVQELPSVFITFVAWCLSEIIRYPHYALLCVGRCPSWLTYLRFDFLSFIQTTTAMAPEHLLLIHRDSRTQALKSTYAGLRSVAEVVLRKLDSFVMFFMAFAFSHRYTAFIVLYPIGLAGEMWLTYKALPFVKEKNPYADFFAALPFSYFGFLMAVLVSYPFGWFQLYLHLLKQRRSKLGRHQGKKNA